MSKQASKVPQFDLRKFKFVHDFILVQAIREEEAGEAGLLVKPEQYEDKPEFGVVVLVGEGRLLDEGTIVPPKVHVGDTIFFGKYSSEQTRNLSKDYFIIRDEDVRAIMPKS